VPSDHPRILVVRFSSIGDVILTTPLLRALRRRHPGARITFVTKRATAPLVEGNPAVDRVVALGPGESVGALASRLRDETYTDGLDLHGSLRSRLLRWRIPARWHGYSKRALPRWALIHLHRDWYRALTPTAERYFEAARELDVRPDGAPPEVIVPEAALEAMDRWRGRAELPYPYVALAPGAAHLTKRWPLDRWEMLARGLARRGVGVLALGGPDDGAAAESVARAAGPRGASAAGQTSLIETAALLARAAALVSGDTGVMHLATAVRTPVVALFGPTVRQFGFFPYSDRAVVLERALPCRPCSAHGGTACPLGHHDCLRTIGVAEVEAALGEWLR
jgi:heptosyltransferase-2